MEMRKKMWERKEIVTLDVVVIGSCGKCLISHSLPLKHGRVAIGFGVFSYWVWELDTSWWSWVEGFAVDDVKHVLAGLTGAFRARCSDGIRNGYVQSPSGLRLWH